MPDDVPVVALVPAAGKGSRLRAEGGLKKQFRLLGEEPVLVRTLEALARHAALSRIVVAVPAGQISAVESQLGAREFDAEIEVVPGGATRQASVRHALETVVEDLALVVVHDGVRPFLPLDRLECVIDAAAEFGAAALAIPVVDTLRRADRDRFGETIDRSGLWRMQTPQVFRAGLLRRAYDVAGASEVTDEVALAGRAGIPVRLIEGDAANIKITAPADWEMAQLLWPAWSSRITEK